jgi:hypothetical protein
MSTPAKLLRLEGLVLFVSSIALYAHLQGNGWLFVGLLLAPDLAALGYLRNPAVGSLFYNAAHTCVTPLTLFVIGTVTGSVIIAQLALIWLAHIGMDRAVGYGLKYAESFKLTHLAKV